MTQQQDTCMSLIKWYLRQMVKAIRQEGTYMEKSVDEESR